MKEEKIIVIETGQKRGERGETGAQGEKGEKGSNGNGYIRWTYFIWIIGGLIAFAGFIYGIRAKAIEKEFENTNKNVEIIRQTFEQHLDKQIEAELKTAAALAEIKQALKIK